MRQKERQNNTVEMYLKKMVQYSTEKKQKTIGTGEVARLVGVTPGTATTMLQKLDAGGYIKYVSHAGCTLRKKGMIAGIARLRRHRLLELFLELMLGYGIDELHDEAERLEQAVSDTFLDRIDALLGSPRIDPYGDEIPRKGQQSLTINDTMLAEAPERRKLIVTRICGDADMLGYFKTAGILPGKEISIQSHSTGAGTADIKCRGKLITISDAVLHSIYIRIR